MMVKRIYCIDVYKLVLWAFMSLSPSLYAGLLDPPVISYSVIDCEKSYLIQVFKDGRVEYRGGEGVTIQGKHSSRISQDTVVALMKSFSGTKNVTSDDQDILPAIMHGMFMGAAIRIRVANKYLTFYSGGKLGEGVVDRYFCLQEFRYLRSTDACKYDHDMRPSVDVLRKWINKQHVFFRWELDIIRAINLTQWVAYPGHALCYRDFPIRSINLKK